MLVTKQSVFRLALPLALAGSLCAFKVSARRPALIQNGHVSPLQARVIFSNQNSRDYIIVSTPGASAYTFKAKGTGETRITLWLDTIATISDTTNTDALFTFKDGSARRLGWDNEHLEAITPEDGKETINLKNVRLVQFLKPPRRDAAGNLMLDQWKYSPYTGEALGGD